jgi:hypothetical protein
VVQKTFANTVTSPPGIRCPRCGRSELRLEQGGRGTVLACASCGTVVRLLQRHGDPQPAFDLDDRTADVPPAGSWWLAFVKGADTVLRPVALAPTLNSCWDAALTCPLRGAVIMIPTDPSSPPWSDPDAAGPTLARRTAR